VCSGASDGCYGKWRAGRITACQNWVVYILHSMSPCFGRQRSFGRSLPQKYAEGVHWTSVGVYACECTRVLVQHCVCLCVTTRWHWWYLCRLRVTLSLCCVWYDSHLQVIWRVFCVWNCVHQQVIRLSFSLWFSCVTLQFCSRITIIMTSSFVEHELNILRCAYGSTQTIAFCSQPKCLQ